MRNLKSIIKDTKTSTKKTENNKKNIESFIRTVLSLVV
jgi:hypothetical protein